MNYEELRDAPAVFSDCEKYRYTLMRRTGADNDKPVVFIMLNPSTADAVKLDPTVTRCFNYAKNWGYGRMYVLNLFSLRETDRAAMMRHPDPGHAGSNLIAHRALLQGLAEDHPDDYLIVCAWGADGNHRGNIANLRAKHYVEMGLELHALAITKYGQPRHPLYLKAELEPKRWSP